MKKVITINLNGRAYQLDDDAFQTLSAYLEQARMALIDNPDLAEILRDLEQAIADKCQRFLGPHKSVVQANEIAQVLEEMGPVSGAGDEASPADGSRSSSKGSKASSQAPHDQSAPRRLYLLEDGEEWIGGVCNGLAAYFRVDAAIVRIIFVVVAVTTSGIASAVYAVLWFTLPVATTSEEVAAAHGAPFNAKEIVDQANLAAQDVSRAAREATAEALKGSREFHKDWTKKHREFTRNWRKERREWRRQRRAWKHALRSGWRTASSPAHPAGPIGYGAQVTAGIMVPVLALVSAGFFWVWAATMMSFLVTGAIFGRSLPGDLPQWAAFLMLIMLFSMISWQIQQARHASHNALGGRYYYGGVAAWDSMMWVGFWLLCGWAAWEFVPEVRQFFSDLPAVADRLREIFRFRSGPV